MKTAFVYPGQGVQKVGMGKDFYENSTAAKDVFEMSSEVLGMDMKKLCFTENDLLDKTEYTQAALVTTCLAMTAALRENGAVPDISAGLSLGEYCALVQSGVMGAADAVSAVRRRGILMQNAVPAGEGAMAAVIGLSASEADAVIKGIPDVYAANYNCPGQLVISGKTAAVKDAVTRLDAAGAKKCVMLNVSGPFHSPMLAKAGELLGEYLDGIKLRDPEIPYIANASAEIIKTSEKIRELLVRQVSSSVRWEESLCRMDEFGTDLFIEIGPGRTVAGFIKKTLPEAAVCNISCFADIEKVTALR